MSTIAIPVLPAASRRSRRVHLLAAAKLMVGGLLLATLFVPIAGGFHGEALWLRCVVYAGGLSLLPAVWHLRGRRSSYPIGADAYLLIPFAFDACGNTLGLYHSVDNFDNFAHLVGTIALTGFAGSLLGARGGDRVVTVIAAAGAAAMFGIGIELVEWKAFAHPVATGFGAYRDTIGDLGMDAAGAIVGAAVLALTGCGTKPV
jgi:hypothetical protein